MKKIYGIILFLILGIIAISCNMENPVIEFKDDAFEQAVRNILEEETEPIYANDVRDITDLELVGQGIEYIDGIEHFISLESLDLEDNFIKDLSPLRLSTSLRWLNLRNNQILDLDAIHFGEMNHLPLTYLSLRHNVVEDGDTETRLSDISLLEPMTRLETLILRDNQITDLSPIESMIRLVELDISQNPLADKTLNGLSYLINLESLNIRETGVTNLDVLKDLSFLNYLNIHSNQSLESYDFLSHLVQLETLIATNVPLGDHIDQLANLYNLNRLNLENTEITDLEALRNLMANGALQDNEELEIYANVNISSNPIPTEAYHLIQPYWENITFRIPVVLPTEDAQTPFINEFMASNDDSIQDFQGDHEDWIEIYNPSETDFDIGGFYLTDDIEDLTKWSFPEDTMIESKGFLTVFASGKNIQTFNQEIHTNFRLNIEGETIILVSSDGQTILDMIENVEVPNNYSYGRREDGANQWGYFDLLNMTPNASNNDAIPFHEDSSIVPDDMDLNTEPFERFFNDDISKNLIIQITEEEWDAYDQVMLEYADTFNGDLRTDFYARANLLYEDPQGTVSIDNIGFRTRGNTSRVRVQNDDGSLNMSHFKISFHETFDDPDLIMNQSRTVFEVEELDMKWNQNYDPTYITEKFSLDLMQSFGVYAAHTTLANVYIEIGETRYFYGVYTVFEPIDQLFLNKRFEEEEAQGDLYKSLWQQYGPASLRDDYPYRAIGSKDESINYRPTYDIKTNKNTYNREALESFISNINQLYGQDFDDFISENFDVDRFLRYMAVGVLLGNPDDYRAMGNNYYLYLNPVTNIWTIIPYDYDHGLGQGWAGEPVFTNWTINNDIYEWGDLNAYFQGRNYSNPLSDKILKIERYQLTYESYLEELIDPNNTYFNYDEFETMFLNQQNLYDENLENAILYLPFGLRDAEWYFTEKIESVRDQLDYYQANPEERPS